jgi:hypothetical protein
MLPINSSKFAKWCDRYAGNGNWYAALWMIVSFVAIVGQIACLLSLGNHPWNILLLLPVFIWLPITLVLGIFDQLGFQSRLERSSSSGTATIIYNSLNKSNKVLAEPLVHKIYELDRLSDKGTEICTAIRSRIELLKDIENKNKQDYVNNVLIDNSDVEAVRSILDAYKTLPQVEG